MTREDKYYIRFRGMVTGPLPYSTIAQQARLGRITRLHELSLDGKTFQPALAIAPGIFNAASSSTAQPSPPAIPLEYVSPETDTTSTSAINRKAARPAQKLSSEKSATKRQSAKTNIPETCNYCDPDESQEISPSQISVTPAYIAAALILLVIALLPNLNSEGQSRWFFNEFSGHKAIAWGGLFVITISIFSLMFSCMRSGKTRGWLMLSLGAGGTFLTGLCGATIPYGWYLFITAVAINLSATTIATSLVSFVSRSHKSIGIIATVFIIIAALLSLIGLDQFAGEKFSASQAAASVMISMGYLAMLISSIAVIFASKKVKRLANDEESDEPYYIDIITPSVKNICISAGFGTIAWLMLAMSCFLLLPTKTDNPSVMTSLPLLRLTIAWICFGAIVGTAACDIICGRQEELPEAEPYPNEQTESQNATNNSQGDKNGQE